MMIDMMYLNPYNYNSYDVVLKNNRVKSVSADYTGYKISMGVNSGGFREFTDLDSLAYIKYKYYDDRRLSDLEFSIKGFKDVRTNMIFTYGSPTADFEAIFLFPTNVGSEQKAYFFCDERGRVLKISISSQGSETAKCTFGYDSGRIENITYVETGPDFYDNLNFYASFKYRSDGLIETETVKLQDGNVINIDYSYTFYE